jgi:hypothetical protein
MYGSRDDLDVSLAARQSGKHLTKTSPSTRPADVSRNPHVAREATGPTIVSDEAGDDGHWASPRVDEPPAHEPIWCPSDVDDHQQERDDVHHLESDITTVDCRRAPRSSRAC